MKYSFTYQELFHELNNYHYELLEQGLTDIEAIEIKRQVLKLFMADRMKKYVIVTGSKEEYRLTERINVLKKQLKDSKGNKND